MSRTLSLVILVGLSGVLGCTEDVGKGDTKFAPIPESTETFAHAAVEVRMIDLAHMVEFNASVERMNRSERTQLWLSLKELHDRVHPSEAAADASRPPEVSFEENGGCDYRLCSHSEDTQCLRPMWCCAFGENATFHVESPCPIP